MAADSLDRNQSWYGAAPLRVESTTPLPGVRLVRLSGDLDLDTHDSAERQLHDLIEPPAQVVVIDLSGVTFCSSSGLRVLVRTADRADEQGIELRLVAASRPVLRPLDVTGLGGRFRLFGSVGEALAATRGGAG